MAASFLRCSSHPGRLLTDHLGDVAARAALLLPGDRFAQAVGLFHDIGKATSYFAAHLEGGAVDPPALSHHAKLGSLFLLASLSALEGVPPLDRALAQLLVRGHHTGLDDLESSLDDQIYSERQVLDRQLGAIDIDGLNSWVRDRGYHRVDVTKFDDVLQQTRLALHFQLMEDISDGEAMRRFQQWLCRFGALIDADRDSAAQLSAQKFSVGSRLTVRRLEDFHSNYAFGPAHESLRALRSALFVGALDAARSGGRDGGLWTLTAPTGSGKTLAALAWALSRRELRSREGRAVGPIIYVLPFTSIIEQNTVLIKSIIGVEAEYPLSGAFAEHHHLAEIGATALEDVPIGRLWSEGWRADVVCTTFVQFVQALFHATPADARRFGRLCGATVILDEVQAVPAEFWPLLRCGIRSLSQNFGVDIALATATQPAIFTDIQGVTEVVSPELETAFDNALDRYDASFDVQRELNCEEFSDMVAREAATARNTLVVVNTVGEALELFRLLSARRELSDFAKFHLSTNLRPIDRARVLMELHGITQEHMLISTQVVEAGVDLSFERVYRANAPIDSIVQAAGRCNRHGNEGRGKVTVVELEERTNRRIYGAVQMDVARQVIGAVCGRTLREPEVRRLTTDFFKLLSEAIANRKFAATMEAVRAFEFRALREKGTEKAVFLIADEPYRVPHFIETGPEDTLIWSRFLHALAESEKVGRRRELRTLRPLLSARIVDVPERFAAREVDPQTGMVHVAVHEAERYYDITTGWVRGVEDPQASRSEIIV